MSKLFEKIKKGEKTEDKDWTEFLVEAHKAAPSMTPDAFASFKTEFGITSYQFLADFIEPKKEDLTVIDLACGDGYLIQFLLPRLGKGAKVIGIDMSEGELAVARKNVLDPRVSFHCSKAQNLPVASDSVDIIVSHMAFMLMLPVEPVVLEISRALKSGGMFHAITGNPKGSKGLFKEIQGITSAFLDSRYPSVKTVRSGDPRVWNDNGLKELFSEKLFDSKIETSDFELQIAGQPECVWTLMKDMYFVGMLPSKERELLKSEMVELAKTKVDGNGNIRFEFPMRRFSVRKQ